MMKNKKEVVVLEFSLPSFNRSDIYVKIEDNKISIDAKKKEENNVNEDDFKWFEKSSRSFNYSSSLPPVRGDEAKIDFLKGKLKIIIPKK